MLLDQFNTSLPRPRSADCRRERHLYRFCKHQFRRADFDAAWSHDLTYIILDVIDEAGRCPHTAVCEEPRPVPEARPEGRSCGGSRPYSMQTWQFRTRAGKSLRTPGAGDVWVVETGAFARKLYTHRLLHLPKILELASAVSTSIPENSLALIRAMLRNLEPMANYGRRT